MKSILKLIVFLSCMAFAGFAIAKPNTGTFSKKQTKQIKSIVHDYLVNNPEVLNEAATALRKKEMEKMQTQAVQSAKDKSDQVFNSQDDIIVGNKNGTITLVEFFDYQCPFCKNMSGPLNNLVKKNPNLRIVFKDFVVHGAVSLEAAKAAMAAYQISPDKYLAFHDALLTSKQPLTDKSIMKLAKKTGINPRALKKAMKNQKIDDTIKGNFNLAMQLKLIGTPSFLIAKTNIAQDPDATIAFVPGGTTEQSLQSMIDKINK
jgi:protein-disulfide isomerase